jgi:hypothetical protein
MKTLEKDELYHNVHGFLKAKGLELKPGSYSQKIQKGCGLLSDAINVSQKSLAKAKVEIDKKLDQLRQVIHEKTAPPGASVPPRPKRAEPGAAAGASSKKPRVRKQPKRRRPS